MLRSPTNLFVTKIVNMSDSEDDGRLEDFVPRKRQKRFQFKRFEERVADVSCNFLSVFGIERRIYNMKAEYKRLKTVLTRFPMFWPVHVSEQLAAFVFHY